MEEGWVGVPDGRTVLEAKCLTERLHGRGGGGWEEGDTWK